MNRRVIVPAPTARQSAARNESHLAGRWAIRRYRPNIRSPRRAIDTKPQTKLVSVINLDNKRLASIKGNEKRVLPIGHSPSQTVAHSAHAARGNGPKDKAEKRQTARKPAAPFTALFIALKADSVEKSAAKQPA